MAKIDIDKFICSFREELERIDHRFHVKAIDKALDEQCLVYKNGKILDIRDDEPKLKVGDWVCHTVYKKPLLIVEDLGEGDFRTEPKSIITAKEFREGFYRLWTIDDAKDGDVLVHSSFMFDDFVFIYNSTSILQAYCYYSSEKKRFIIEDRGRYCPWNMQEVKPATKEQRDTLFAKMKEAGCEWDAEHKQLKKIEPSAWSEEDEREVAVLEAYIRSKDWSERHIDRALGIVDELVNKAKSLRPQKHWKPSDEQVIVLAKASEIYCGTDKGVLYSLYNDLKKLK